MIGIGKLVVGFVLAAGGVGTSVAVVNASGTTERDERRQSEARERAVQQEREQQAARERGARTAEAARQERERRAAAQAAQRQKQAAESPKQAENKPGNSSGGPAGYTGPRCYAPGGKTWRPC